MSQGTFPKPYVGDVKEDRATAVYVPFETMGIGARKSGMPASASKDMRSIEHVGGTAGKSGKKDRA